MQDGERVQGLINLGRLQAKGDIQADQFKEFYHLARRGDIVGMLLEKSYIVHLITISQR